MSKRRDKHKAVADKPPQGLLQWLATPKGTLWALFGLALLLRFIHLFFASDGPTFYTPAVDAQLYDRAARDLVMGKGWTEDFFLQGFLYPAFLALAYLVSSGSILFAKLLQALLGAATVLLAARLAQQLYGNKAAWITGLTLCLYGPMLFFESEILATSLAAFLFTLLVTLFITTLKKPSQKHFALLGAVGLLAILARAPLAAAYLVGCLWLFCHLYRQQVGRDTWLAALALPITFIVLAIPPAWLSHSVTGRLSILPSSGGINLYAGNQADRIDKINARPGNEWQQILWIPARAGVEGTWNENDYFTKLARDNAIDKPGEFIIGLVGKSWEMLSSREIPRNFDPYSFRQGNPFLSVSMWKVGGFGFPFGLLLPIALLGYWLQRKKTPAVIGLSMLAYAATIVLVFVSARYRIPLIPLLAILFGAGIATLSDLIKIQHWKTVTLTSLAVVLIMVAISLPTRFAVEGDLQVFAAEMKLFAADDATRLGKKRLAVQLAEEAVALKPELAQSLAHLGLKKMQAGDRSGAERELLRAVALAPGLTAARVNLGVLYAEGGRPARSIPHLRAALETNPYHPSAHATLGGAYAMLGKNDDAIKHMKIAIDKNPWDADTLYNFAILLAKRGDREEALQAATNLERVATVRKNRALAVEAAQLRSMLLRRGM